jgi:DNA end-binding protein Ku
VPPKKKRAHATQPSESKRAVAAERGDDAAARPIAHGVWSGSISFGLVTIPIELYSATRRSKVAMRMLGADGSPLARQYVCPADGQVLADDEIERGYEVEEGRFVLVSDEELEELAPRRSRDIELTRFVPRDAIDPVYFVTPYIALPAAEQTKAYRLLVETMEATQRAALAHFVMRGKAYPVALFVDRGVLRAVTLRFGDELRSPVEMGIGVPAHAEPARVAEMERAIAGLTQKNLDERELVDEESSRVLELARMKLARGLDVVNAPEVPPPPESREAAADGGESGGQVIDLFALIQKRLSETAPQQPPRQRVAKVSPRARATGTSDASPKRARKRKPTT